LNKGESAPLLLLDLPAVVGLAVDGLVVGGLVVGGLLEGASSKETCFKRFESGLAKVDCLRFASARQNASFFAMLLLVKLPDPLLWLPLSSNMPALPDPVLWLPLSSDMPVLSDSSSIYSLEPIQGQTSKIDLSKSDSLIINIAK
jgi:hypothetical protein